MSNQLKYSLLLTFIVILVIIFILIWLDLGYTIGLNNCDFEQLDTKYRLKPRVESKCQVIISLTTIPDRIALIKPTLISLLSQSHRVDNIKINLPYYSNKGKRYVIPDWLERLTSIELIRVNRDEGPATKLLPTLRTVKGNARIIVVDDDVIYGHCLVNGLIKQFERLNRNGNRVAVTTTGGLSNDTGITRWSKFISGNIYVDYLHGYGGYVVTPAMFPSEVFNYQKAPKAAFCVDDSWFSGWLRVNRVKIYMIGWKHRAIPLPNCASNSIDALCQGCNQSGKNDNIVNTWFRDKYYV